MNKIATAEQPLSGDQTTPHAHRRHPTTSSADYDRILELERKKQAFLLYSMSITGIITCTLFGLQNLQEGHLGVGLTVTWVGVLICANLTYYLYSGRLRLASSLISAILFTLGGFLLAGGGYHNTAPFWLYPILAISVFLNTFRVGLCFGLFFMLFSSGLLFIPDNPLLTAYYPLVMKIRFTITIAVLLSLCIAVQYSSEQFIRQAHSLHNKLVLAANTDSLTNLPNRRFMFDQYFRNESFFGQSGEHSVMLCDVDRFKQINDRFGHDTGDRVLQKISIRFRDLIRETDIIARWGGEEFLILLPDTPYATALERAERIRQSIFDMPFKLDDRKYHLSISIGVAAARKNQSIRSLLKQADEKLYEAKGLGRNKVC